MDPISVVGGEQGMVGSSPEGNGGPQGGVCVWSESSPRAGVPGFVYSKMTLTIQKQ